MDVVVERVFTFTIRIIKSLYGAIVVGVLDRDQQKQAQESFDS
jgi:hypothetical protein